jgi:hypothetical protein
MLGKLYIYRLSHHIRLWTAVSFCEFFNAIACYHTLYVPLLAATTKSTIQVNFILPSSLHLSFERYKTYHLLFVVSESLLFRDATMSKRATFFGKAARC